MKIVLCIVALIIGVILIWFLIPYSPLRSKFYDTVKEKKRENIRFDDSDVFSSSDFESFPVAVQNYIEHCGYLGTKKQDFVKMVYHDVDFTQGKDGPKLKIDYTQYDFAKQPDRLALIESRMFGVPFQGYDYYEDGIRHPTKFRAIWNYSDGDFVYFDGSIVEISYNK